ncbi:MAG: 50S ribosomal protein L31e [Candidatus ainarchaeum sp.]|nr:50S ribosomal protein L31e [Candidatus ainarchaeum sp.]
MPSDNYIIPLTKAHDDKPRTKRANVAVRLIYDFLYKHTRKEKKDILITEEVNNYIWKNSIQNPPRKVAVTLKKKDEKYYVFLKDSENSKKFSVEKKEDKKKVKETKPKTEENITKDEKPKEIVAKTEDKPKAEVHKTKDEKPKVKVTKVSEKDNVKKTE